MTAPRDIDASFWDEALPELEEQQPASPGVFVVPIVVNRDADVPSELMELLMLVPRFADTWERRRPDLKEQTLSGYEMSLADQMADAGLADYPQLICDVLCEFRRKWQGKEHGQSYYVHTIGKAVASAQAKKGDHTGNSATETTNTTDNDEAADAPNTESTKPEGQEMSNPPAPRGFAVVTGLSASALASAILRKDRFAVDPGGKLYRYTNRVYAPGGEAFIRRRVKELILAAGKAPKWSSHKAEETVRYICADAPRLWSEPPLQIINVINGLLNVRTRELQPHTPEHLWVIRIPVVYDPEAQCPSISGFVSKTFPSDSVELASEIAYGLLAPDFESQQAVLAKGEGGNGKSTFLRLMVRFIGEGNTTAMSLQRLESDRFAVAALYGKLANVCPDLPSNKLKETSIFKAITGGDHLTGEHKFKDLFTFRPFCRLLFSANRMPQSPDDSDAFFRRWIVIPFIRVFREGAPETLPQRVLLDKMTTPGELSGLLNLALAAGDRLRAQGHFTQSDSVAEAGVEFRRTTDPFHVWLSEHTVLVPKGFVVQKDLYKQYGEECRRAERAMPSPNEITAMIQRIHPGVKLKQKRVNRKRAWCYCGIGWLTSESSNE